MGSSASGILAYGYNLGGDDGGWEITQTDEYGGLEVDWFDEDDDEDGFVQQAEQRLLVAAGFTETDWQVDGYFARLREAEESLGVKFDSHGWGEEPQHVLAAKVITVEWGAAKVLDLPSLMAEPAEHGWDDKLAAALTTLGITPKQEQPGWLLCAYYG